MKKLSVFKLLYLSCAFACGNNIFAGNLNQINIDNGWYFRLNPHDKAISADYEHTTWQAVDLPHDWSVGYDFSPEAKSGNDGGYLTTGKAVYRKVLPAGIFSEGKRHRLYVEGAYMDSKVYVNGDSVGGHPYGYSSYFLDITPYVTTDSVTTLAISVDNSRQKNSRWYSGSGIYRHVWVSESPFEFEIEPWSLSTKSSAPDKDGVVTVNVAFNVINYDDAKDKFSVNVAIGNVTSTKNVVVAPNDTLTVEIPVKVKNAKLWSPETPNLYPLSVTVSSKKHKAEDRVSERIGLRTFSYSSTEGFLLNGKPIEFAGACVHHDHGILGAASYDDAEFRKVQLMKDAGFNALRTSHGHPSPTFLTVCDSLGMLVIDEAFDGWEQAKNPFDYNRQIGEWWASDLEALVCRDRNHPSVVAWSIGNEILERKTQRAVELAAKFSNHVRERDPQRRPVTQAIAAWDSDWEIYDSLAAQHEIIGYNYMIHKAQSDHERVPSRIIWQTESYPRDVFDNWAQVHDNSYVIGDFVWTGIDYIGESGIGRHYYNGQVPGEHYHRDLWPWHGSECGDLDIIGQRKPLSYYRDMMFNYVGSDSAYIYMAVREPEGYRGEIQETLWGHWPTYESWNWRGWENKPIEVEVITTMPRVTLLLNGNEVAQKDVDRSTQYKAVFTIPYTPGTIQAIGTDANGNRRESKKISTVSWPAKIRLNVERPGKGRLAYVTTTLVDENDNIVPDNDLMLNFEAIGNAEILATGSADMTDPTGYSRPSRRTHRGYALAVVRLSDCNKSNNTADDSAGAMQNLQKATLRVAAPGLPVSEIDL